METLCQSCGFNNPPGMRFCGNCGKPLNAEATTVPDRSKLPEHLGVLVGSDLLVRFREAGLEAAGQRRHVTVLFADLSDYTSLAAQIDSEDLYEIVQQYIGMLVNAVYQSEGMVDKIVGDGLMALFGAPIAHENNAERALHAALEMQSGLEPMNQDLQHRYGIRLQMHIGLHSGVVIVGSVGSNMLMDYTAIGDTVNLAQRLEEAAPGGTILVSEVVYQQTRRLFDFQSANTYQLKGFPAPVNAYQVIGKKAQPGSVRGLEGLRAPMIGRESELKALLQATERLSGQQEGSFALVRGEAGLGKSRLVAELGGKINLQKIQVFHGQSLTYRRSVAYWIFQDVLRNIMGITPELSAAQIRQRLAKTTHTLLGGRAVEVLAYLEQLFSLRPSDAQVAERIEFLDANQLRQQVFIAVREVLLALARQKPVLLILDDLHWADDASLDLLLFLLDTVRQNALMICGITRPFDGGQLAQLEERAGRRLVGHYLDIRLSSLLPEQSEQLFFELLNIPELPLSLREKIIRRAAGVPFYLEEILRMLIDNNMIFFESGHWRLRVGADVANLGVPDNLQALILTRFDHLPPDDRRILQVASVIGREFSPAVVAQILDL
ncbi:MAG: AAA family ATPase, partial [Anaerolineales bacterium]|nr:AAA family ATPase [Anaerolineales bacterium]